MSVGEVDILVGVPSHNHAKTIAQTIEAIESSLRRDFWRERGVIVNVDAGSRDGTAELAMAVPAAARANERGLNSLRTVHRITTQHKDASDGIALRTILAAAELSRAKACAVISPDSSAITPEWIAGLIRPIMREGFDFVAPLYTRRRFDALLPRNVLYPFYRAAFGYRIRELRSGEFGFSGRLASASLGEEEWNGSAIRTWPEGWIATSALAWQMRSCQVFLGPRVQAPAVSGTDVVLAIREAIDAFFCLLESRQPLWINRAGSEPVPTVGPDHEINADSTRINRKRILEMFRSGVSQLRPVLQSILSAGTLAEIERLAAADDREFAFPDEVWVKSLYELAGSYHRSVISRAHMIQAFVPLYRGRIYSFLLRHQESSADEIEAASESLCLEFERLKPYLIERWTAKT